VHIISRRRLAEFWRIHPDAEKPLKVWHALCETTDFENFAHLKRAIGKSVDKVGEHTVFDISGNKFRLITVIHYNRRKIYIRDVFTHAEYDRKFRKNE
jgi:mRNA interferase HigB